MVFDSISNGHLPSVSRDTGKKKRTNRLAKLKQCKLDVRREQWLSHVKNKGCKLESNGRGEPPPPSVPVAADQQNRSLDCLEMTSRGEDNEGSSIQDSDIESLMNSPIGSSLGFNDSRKDFSASSITSISSGCCSETFSEHEEDDGCLDDWEAVADALNASDNQHNQISDSPVECENRDWSTNPEQSNKSPEVDLPKTEDKGMFPDSHANCRAWRADDTFRPQSLPHLSKPQNFSMNSDWQCDRGAITWAWKSIMSQPTSCPICYEDLDVTDSSFLPCPCGFRLCLFCHKRILESDGRCPCCRKQYDHVSGAMDFN